MAKAKRVIIVGGGFGGLNAAKRLADAPGLEILLIDQRNHHLFQPLLYQVATAGLNPADIAVPIRSQFPGAANVRVQMGHVTRVQLKERFVELGFRPIAGAIEAQDRQRVLFDYLILACGAQHSYFGKPEWENFAPGLKSLEQATEIRRRILFAFEQAENELDPERQRALLTFVVVGGGPTGMELAGAIADISRTVLIRDFRRINPASARIVLVEAGPRVVPSFSEDLSAHALHDLEQLGVEVRTGARVSRIDAEGVELELRASSPGAESGTERVSARTTLWAAGVQAAGISRRLETGGNPVDLDRAGRVMVGPDLTIPGFPRAFVIGDLAHLDLGDGKVLPGLAPAAIQAGRSAASNILADLRGQARKPFHYFDKGQMATIGKRKAIAQMGRFKIQGFLAWLAWLFVHVLYLIGFRNRVAVLFEWAWSYLFSRRGARLITQRDWTLEALDSNTKME